MPSRQPPTDDEKQKFLKEDLYDSLRWLFVAAVVWRIPREQYGIPHQRALAMAAAVMQARALYDFFFGRPPIADDARASDFNPNWHPKSRPGLDNYLGDRQPANKRLFHLVYNRSQHSGGSDSVHESDHLKNQVVAFARELRDVTKEFILSIGDSKFRSLAQGALDKAIQDASSAAAEMGATNPLTQ